VGEIKMQSGCFYAYDGISRHVVNKNPSEGCPDIKCAFGSILLKQWDSAIGYRQSYAANCSGDGNWLSLTCNADGSMWDGGEYYPYCYNLDDEGSWWNLDTSCLFGGQTVLDWESVTWYYASSVPAGDVCKLQVRTCNYGHLSGNYRYSDCKVACEFNNQSIPHWGSVIAYQSPTTLERGSCISQERTCNNWVLSGTYTYSKCYRWCYWPTWDGTWVRYPHGAQKTWYTTLWFLTNGHGSNVCPDVRVLTGGICRDGTFSNGITEESYWNSSANAALYPLESCPAHWNCTYAIVSIWDESNERCNTRTGYNLVNCESGYRVNGDICSPIPDTRCSFSGVLYMPGDTVYWYADLDAVCPGTCRKIPAVCQLNWTWSQNIYTSCTLHDSDPWDYILRGCPEHAVCEMGFVSTANKDNTCNNNQPRFKLLYCRQWMVRCSTGENCTCRPWNSCKFNGLTMKHWATWYLYSKEDVYAGGGDSCKKNLCPINCNDWVIYGAASCKYTQCAYHFQGGAIWRNYAPHYSLN